MSDANNPAPVDPATPEGNTDPKLDPNNEPALDPGSQDPGAAGDPPVVPEPSPADDPAALWPEDWRQRYAGEDEKKLKQLERYASPQAALDALFAAQAKIRSGELKTALKPDATPEEVAQWRSDNGIPESPDKYEVKLPDGLVASDEDKAVIDGFLKSAHEANMHPDQVNKALAWYMDQQEKLADQRAQADAQIRQQTEDVLREEFGPDYRRNIKAVDELLSGAPGELKDRLLGARLSDGTPLGNDPDAIRWLVGLARELNPIGTVLPGSGSNATQALADEKAGIEALMGDRSSEYWKGPKAAQLQARYRELITAEEKYAARN